MSTDKGSELEEYSLRNQRDTIRYDRSLALPICSISSAERCYVACSNSSIDTTCNLSCWAARQEFLSGRMGERLPNPNLTITHRKRCGAEGVDSTYQVEHWTYHENTRITEGKMPRRVSYISSISTLQARYPTSRRALFARMVLLP
jgi:hypothetical protein